MIANNLRMDSPGYNPEEWEFRVRRKDGNWLSQPLAEGQPIRNSNQETWTRRLCDTWAFETQREAAQAARTYCVEAGFDPDGWEVIPVPKDPLAWLKKGRS
jgi:hypothetical protein